MVAKQQNDAYDKRVDEEDLHNSRIKNSFKKNVLSQIKQNAFVQSFNKELELSKPHIEGNMGYPPRPQLNHDEAKVLKRHKQEINKNSLLF